MADLKHVTKQELINQLESARKELQSRNSDAVQALKIIEKANADILTWKTTAEDMKANNDALAAQIEDHIAENSMLSNVLGLRERNLNDTRALFHRADKDAGLFAQERDQARAALQALALSTGRLTEHMDARELVMSATDTCTPK